MSAAEKLKALSVSHAIDWPAPSYEAYRLAEDQERLRKNAIDRALPQIVAVVEDAEFVSDYHKAHGNESREAAWLINLRDSIAALDAALTVGGKE